MPLTIGSVALSTPLLLAPIARYCDLPFRLLTRRQGGVGLASTDLLCPQALLNESVKSMWLAATSPEDQPICMQLYGRDPHIMAEAARWAEQHGACVIDINMGCPVDKVTKKNGGSKLLCEPDVAIDIARNIIAAVEVPVTAKIRLGWDETTIITDTLPVALADVGVAAITVHGRTTEQKFRGQARLEGIVRVVESMARHHPDVPVIGNGDVKSPTDAWGMMQRTGCRGVMIGRGALGQPWIFKQTADLLATGHDPGPPPRAQRVAIVIEHLDELRRHQDDRYALNTIRQRVSWYSPHLQPWPHLRHDVQQMRDIEQLREFLVAGRQRIAEQEIGSGQPASLDQDATRRRSLATMH